MKKVFIIMAASSLLMTSCATIFTGTKDRISFKTNPSGATVLINGVEQCKTPCTLNVKRKLGDSDVEFKLDGYETRVVTLDKSFNVVSVINLGSLLGWGVDLATGSVMKYDKKAYDLELSKEKKTSQLLPNKININTESKVAELFVMAN